MKTATPAMALLCVVLAFFVIWVTVQKLEPEPVTVASGLPPLPPWDLALGSPPPAVAPFGAAAAKQHQEAWAEHLGVPVELENSVGMKFLLIPPGEFDMGTSKEEVARLLRQVEAQNLPKWYRELLSSEVPKHRVRITKAFYLGMNEVTQVEYERVMAGDRSRLKDNLKHPAPHLTWERAVEFCRALRELPEEKNSRADYRLPTEAEWEYACRAGTTTRWYATNDETAFGEQAWCAANAGGTTHPVGQKSPSAWGLHDMHGNVREWCADWYDPAYYANSPLDDPRKLVIDVYREGMYRVIRGGSFRNDAARCRTSFRHGDKPAAWAVDLGFRVVRTVARGSEGPRVTGPRAYASFDTPTAKQHQEAWAKHLGWEVEIENSIGMRLKLIPAGEFVRGAVDSVMLDQKPQHLVHITKPFYLGVYPVTQAQWESVMGNSPSHFQGLQNPVERVSWDDVQAFLQQLNAKADEAGRVYRLPTEAEWEYACRAGTMTDFYFGNDQAELDKYVWYGLNSSGRPHPVGQKMPNAWGLYDLHGNVWEWCQDWYYWGYYMCSPMYDPQGPAEGSKRVIRGGSWSSEASSCGLTGRHAEEPGRMHVNLGFRVAMAAPPVSR